MIKINKLDLDKLEHEVRYEKGIPILTYRDESGIPLGNFVPSTSGVEHIRWDKAISPVDVIITKLGETVVANSSKKFIRVKLKAPEDTKDQSGHQSEYYALVVKGVMDTMMDHLGPEEDLPEKEKIDDLIEDVQQYYDIIEQWALMED